MENKNKSFKKKVSALALGVSGIVIAGASLALFTDRASLNTKGTAGTLGLDVKELNMTNKDNINPGDNDPEALKNTQSTTPHEITFSVTNTGNKSIRTRHTFVLNVKDTKGVNLDPSVIEILNNEDKKVELTGKKYIDSKGVETDTKSNDVVAIKYVILSDTLNGIGAGDAVEKEEGGKEGQQNYKYHLKMSKNAENEYQGATVNMDVVIEAMQYRNTTDDDWKEIKKETIQGTSTGQTVNAVPSK